MAEVVFEKVTKVYPRGVRALADLTLTIRNGERLVLVGPSGSGKSTALRLIAGLETPTSGSVRLAGRDMHGVSPRERNVALMFQRPTFYPHLNVRENLAFGARLRGRGWIGALFDRVVNPGKSGELARQAAELDQRVAEAARFLELEEVLERRPGQLSGGQQQRVALGRALVRRPAVFLLDEPLSNLEPRLRTDLRRQLHLLQRRLDATMIAVTHDPIEALTFGERVAVLDGGVLQQAARPQELYERPGNRFVAGFIGWPPMNFLAGRVTVHDNEPRLSTEIGSLTLPADVLTACKAASIEVGIRPEHLTLAATAVPGRSLALAVELIEPLGDSTLVTCRRETVRLTARVAGRPAWSVGEMVEVVFDMARIYLFESMSGRCLTAGAG